jgi:ethanolamine transporter EutH
MPLYEAPPHGSRTTLAVLILAGVAALAVHVVAGFLLLLGFALVPLRAEDRQVLDAIRIALAAAWVVLGLGFLIGWYFRKSWTLLLPLVVLALVWFGLKAVPAYLPIGDPGR